MWVLQSGAFEDIKATFFHYSGTRSQKIALELIDDFEGYLTTDAYAAYSNMHLEDVKNNFCESHIRSFATARRAWFFADTPNGARANAVLYTLVETARANDLNVYAYLDYLLAEMPNKDFTIILKS